MQELGDRWVKTALKFRAVSDGINVLLVGNNQQGMLQLRVEEQSGCFAITAYADIELNGATVETLNRIMRYEAAGSHARSQGPLQKWYAGQFVRVANPGKVARSSTNRDDPNPPRQLDDREEIEEVERQRSPPEFALQLDSKAIKRIRKMLIDMLEDTRELGLLEEYVVSMVLADMSRDDMEKNLQAFLKHHAAEFADTLFELVLRAKRKGKKQQNEKSAAYPPPKRQRDTEMADFPRLLWRVLRDGTLVRSRVELTSAQVRILSKNDIVEQTGIDMTVFNKAWERGVQRIPITLRTEPNYPEPIGWVTLRAEDKATKRQYLVPFV